MPPESIQGDGSSVTRSPQADPTKQFKTQLPRNLFLQVCAFAMRIAVGILLTPYLVHQLGRAAYGLVPIAGVMTQYVALITICVSSSVSRFLSIALQKEDLEDSNRIFNTAFFSYVGLGLIQMPIFGLIIYFARTVFTIPPELYHDAIILLVCSALSFVINLVCSVFGVPIYANNRLDMTRSVEIGSEILRLVGIVTLFVVLGPALRRVGYVDLTVTVLRSATYAVIGKRLAPMLKINLRAYDWHKVRQLTSMGWWLLINQIAFLLFLRIDIWVCNRFIGAEQAGDYAAVLQWSNLIRQAGALLSGVTGPMVMIYYARAQMESLVRLSQLSVRVLCIFLAIPISILCVSGSLLLKLWLGTSFVHLAPLLTVLVCHLVINVGVLPLFSIQTALNRVKWPGLVSLVMGVCNLTLAITFAKYLDWGVYGIAIAGALVLTLKNAVFTPVYAARILGRPWYTFVWSQTSGLVLLAALTTFGYALKHYVGFTSWAQVVVVILMMGLSGLTAAWLVLPRTDRRLLIDLAPGPFRALTARWLPA